MDSVITVSPNSPLRNLLELIFKSVSDSDVGARSEGGRVVANLIKSCLNAHGEIFSFFFPFKNIKLVS